MPYGLVSSSNHTKMGKNAQWQLHCSPITLFTEVITSINTIDTTLNMKPLFSIVIPCCNVGKYVRECLNSIKKQSFENWECLCIIEESTDDTESIVREFAENDQRLRVFTGPRSGSVSVPRNIGMDNANGEYIIFCDGDDSLVDGSLSQISEKIAARPGADFYACAIWEYNDESGEHIRTVDNFLPDAPDELSGHDAILMLYKHWTKPHPMLQDNVWRRDFLNEHKLRCIPGLFNQDSEFFPRALYLAKRIVPLHVLLYLYRRNTASITLKPHEPGFGNKHWCIILKSLFEFYAKESEKPGFDKRIAECWARLWIDLLYDDWFRKKAVQTVPRQKRMETLKIMFSNGFGNLKKLAANTTLPRRSLVYLVQLYVQCPLLAWPIEQLFIRVAFPLAYLKNGNRSGACHVHGTNA